MKSIRDLRDMLDDLPRADVFARHAAASRQNCLVKPPGSLGRLEDIALHLAAWQRRAQPSADNVRVLVFAGSHGITVHGVSAYPDAVNAQMLAGFRAGHAAICQLANAFGATLSAIDCGIDRPTADFTCQPAMTEPEFVAAVRIGIDAVTGDEDLLILGDMGIGNTTAAAAIAAGLFGGGGADWVGPGTGVDPSGLQRKAAVVDQALATHRKILTDPFAVAQCVGGRELAAILGATLAARRRRIPLLLDGFIVTAAVAPLHRAAGPDALGHALAGHVSAEPGHRRLLEIFGLDPLLSLGMRLGEGSGAAAALGLVRAALACHNGMATFDQAGVSGQATDIPHEGAA